VKISVGSPSEHVEAISTPDRRHGDARKGKAGAGIVGYRHSHRLELAPRFSVPQFVQQVTARATCEHVEPRGATAAGDGRAGERDRPSNGRIRLIRLLRRAE
jgi:hypothetical protein